MQSMRLFQEKLAALPPLHVPKKPIGLESSTGTVAVDFGEDAPEDLKKLSRDTRTVLGVRIPFH